MAATEDCQAPLHSTFTDTVPDPLPNAPFVPSPEEAKHRYYGIPSQPLFVARSSHDIWLMPTGMEAYLQPKELRRVGGHALCNVWDGGVDVAMHTFLVEQNVHYTSLDPVRIGIVGEPAAPVIIWVGVEPGSLSAERGIEVAVGLRALLLQSGIEDIRESMVATFAKLYKPALTSNPTVQVREPFSTALGITICAEEAPDVQGTATLFFTVSSRPKQLFLLAPKHVLFRAEEESDHYEYHGSGPRRNVLLMGTNGFEARIKDIEREIWGCQILIDHLKARLALVDEMEDAEDAQAERNHVQPQLGKTEKAIKRLEEFLADVRRDWKDPKQRIIGHVVLSPPLILSAGNDGFTQDFAVIQVDTTKIDATNFIGNAIELGTEIPVPTFTAWMRPNHANQPEPSFKYPLNRLLQFRGTLSNEEMRSHSPKDVDDRGDPTIMVLKRGCTSGLTVGCINNLHSVLRKAFKTKPEEYSKEVTVLPHTHKSGSFSEAGDSGAAVVNGWGAVGGMLTGGSGSSEASDCAYVTPIAFLLKCLEENGFRANIFPVAADVFA
ncbi:hypothetical protein FRB90_007531 [Tulasnella sp. 427]|nr:hypothetical protein FRB90_007531 [Tulasnella sp. 427]